MDKNRDFAGLTGDLYVRILVTSVLWCLGVGSLLAQQVPNSDFEQWTLVPGSGQYKDYEEPSDGWASGNGAIHIAAGADPVCEKTTDAKQGTYAAKLVTRKIFGQVASGSLFTGTFQLNLADPVNSARRGIPFVGRPTTFRGWFKYAPVGGDSATLYATLSRWDGSQRQRIGEARIMQHSAQDEWLWFEIPFMYDNAETPDTIAVVFASSAGGEFFRGGEGSTLIVDGIALWYEPLSVEDKAATPMMTVFPTHLWTETEFERASVYDLVGNLVTTVHRASTIQFDTIESGVYFLKIKFPGNVIVTQTFCKP